MKNQKMYEADDKMISIIRDNYNILFAVQRTDQRFTDCKSASWERCQLFSR